MSTVHLKTAGPSPCLQMIDKSEDRRTVPVSSLKEGEIRICRDGLREYKVEAEQDKKGCNAVNYGSFKLFKLFRELHPVVAAADPDEESKSRRQDVAALALEIHGICIKEPKAEIQDNAA